MWLGWKIRIEDICQTLQYASNNGLQHRQMFVLYILNWLVLLWVCVKLVQTCGYLKVSTCKGTSTSNKSREPSFFEWTTHFIIHSSCGDWNLVPATFLMSSDLFFCVTTHGDLSPEIGLTLPCVLFLQLVPAAKTSIDQKPNAKNQLIKNQIRLSSQLWN